MALRRRRRVLATPWWIVAGLLLLSIATTALSLRVVAAQNESDEESLATTAASSIAQDLTRTLSRFYTPTVVAEGFVGATIAETRESGRTADEALAGAWASFAAPLADNLGETLLDFQLAPEAIVTYSTRPEENAAALGHNLLIDDDRRDQIIEVIAARGPKFAGPLDLLQGGTGLIIRQAVFLPGLDPFAERFARATGDRTDYEWLDEIPEDFWGMTTTVIDFDGVMQVVGGGLSDDLLMGVFTMNPDGSVGDPVWGDLTAESPYVSEQEVTLVDGSRWLVRVDVPATPWQQYWPLLLIGLAMTLVFLGLARVAYRAHSRNRIGFTFSESISHLTTREAVLEQTSLFLAELYPGIRGRVSIPDQRPHVVTIPLGQEWVASDGTHSLEWQIVQAGDVQCVIEIDSDGPFHQRELDEVIQLIRRILGTSLAALGRQGQLEHRAATDFLTEAYNRSQLVPVFEQVQSEARRTDRWVTVACLDIDDFKGVNDSLGHLFGDEVLRTLTVTLKSSLRSSDAVVRFGGDEFVVLASVPDPDHAGDLCERLQEQATHALTVLADGQRAITVSLGFTTVPGREPATVEDLLAQADAALYSAKEAGGAHVQKGHPVTQDRIR